MIHYAIVILESLLITVALAVWLALDRSEIQWAWRVNGFWLLTVFWWTTCWQCDQVGKLFAKYDKKRV